MAENRRTVARRKSKLDAPPRTVSLIRAVPKLLQHSWSLRIAIMVLACASVLSARADSLYDNGTPSGLGAWGIDHFLNADDFMVDSRARIEGITIRSVDVGNHFAGSFVWQIYANGSDNQPGQLLFSGISTSLTHTQTGGSVLGYAEYVDTINISPVVLEPGTYWFALHNGSLGSDVGNPGDFFFWETTAQGDNLPGHGKQQPYTGEWFDWIVPGRFADFAFQIQGVPAARGTSVTSSSGGAHVRFLSTANQHYRVEYKNALTDKSWSTVPGADNITGTGAVVDITDSGAHLGSTTRRFYRVLLL